MQPSALLRSTWLPLTLLAASCSGQIATGRDRDETPSGAGGGGSSSSAAGHEGGHAAGAGGPTAELAEDAADTGLRRLTNREYANTLADLFGAAASGVDANVSEASNPFGFATSTGVATVEVDRYREAAEAVAAAAVAKLDTLLPCAAGGAKPDEATCARQFVTDVGKRVFRRPLAADEIAPLTALFGTARQTVKLDFRGSIQIVLEAMLQDPRFLYVREYGSRWPRAASELVPLTAYEMASRLSYLLWGTMPDATLLTEADAGRLTSQDQISAQVMRMLKDDRAASMLADFHARWLDLQLLPSQSRDSKLFPEFTDAARGAMAEETQRFVRDVVLAGDGSVATLLTAGYSFVNADLAKIYGVTAGGDYARTDLDPTQRRGVLTHASVLTTKGTVIKRGKFVRERLFCQMLPQPPANVPQANPSLAPREQAEQHATNPTCAGCHKLIDPLGFGFVAYDSIGRYRPSAAGKMVDDAGNVTGTDVDGAYDGLLELADRLARSSTVSDCVVRQWFRYATGRDAAVVDADELGDLRRTLDASGIKGVLTALVTSPAFTHHRTTAGEQTP